MADTPTTDPYGPPPLAYRPADAAKVIGCSRALVYDLVAAGRLPGRKLGTATLVLRSDLEAFLRALPLAVPDAESDASAPERG